MTSLTGRIEAAFNALDNTTAQRWEDAEDHDRVYVRQYGRELGYIWIGDDGEIATGGDRRQGWMHQIARNVIAETAEPVAEYVAPTPVETFSAYRGDTLVHGKLVASDLARFDGDKTVTIVSNSAVAEDEPEKTYTIFDGNPSSGPCAWPSHEDLEFTDMAAAIEDAQKCALECGEYEAEDNLWILVHDDVDTVVDQRRFSALV